MFVLDQRGDSGLWDWEGAAVTGVQNMLRSLHLSCVSSYRKNYTLLFSILALWQFSAVCMFPPVNPGMKNKLCT